MINNKLILISSLLLTMNLQASDFKMKKVDGNWLGQGKLNHKDISLELLDKHDLKTMRFSDDTFMLIKGLDKNYYSNFKSNLFFNNEFYAVVITKNNIKLTKMANPPKTKIHHFRDTKYLKPLTKSEILSAKSLLTNKKIALCPTINDRAAWDKLAQNPLAKDIIIAAAEFKLEDLTEIPAKLYFDFYITGNRANQTKAVFEYSKKLWLVVMAECLENKGRYIDKIETLIGKICAFPTWLAPAHDHIMSNYNQENIDIALRSSMMGAALGSLYQIMDNKISKDCRKEIKDNLQTRLIKPFLAMVHGQRTYNWWIVHHCNWNSVCLAGVLNAALMTSDDQDLKAEVVAAVIKYSPNYINGYNDDGCCSEGVSYWNYGFVNYTALAELLYKATAAKLDLFDNPKIDRIANYGNTIEVVNGVYPAFADCGIYTSAAPEILNFFDERNVRIVNSQKTKVRATILNFLAETQKKKATLQQNAFNKLVALDGYCNLFYLTAFSEQIFNESNQIKAQLKFNDPKTKTFFADTERMICRYYSPDGDLGLALKAGDNQEMHNHNDVGSYMLVVNSEILLVDPGNTVYTAATFSPQRYEDNALNSFGHPVPVISGELQPVGKEFSGEIIVNQSSATNDHIVIDFAKAYAVDNLKSLTRTFDLKRQGAGQVEITDAVAFGEADTFETALIALGRVEIVDGETLKIIGQDNTLDIKVRCDASAFDFVISELKSDFRDNSTRLRIGIKLKSKIKKGQVKIILNPSK